MNAKKERPLPKQGDKDFLEPQLGLEKLPVKPFEKRSAWSNSHAHDRMKEAETTSAIVPVGLNDDDDKLVGTNDESMGRCD